MDHALHSVDRHTPTADDRFFHALRRTLTAMRLQTQLLRRQVQRGELDQTRLVTELTAIDAGITTLAAQLDEQGHAAR